MTLLLSHMPCFVSESRCSCSLMCLALSQHHAAIAISCALLCLIITLLLLSHVPCFVSSSRCYCYLMCLALSHHHAAIAFSCTLLCLSITLLLAFSCALLCLSITLHSISCRSNSHVPSFVSVAFSSALICLSILDAVNCSNLMCLVTCALLCLNITPLLLLTLSQGITLLFKCSLCALLCLAQHHDALSSASPQHHAAHVPCLVSAWHHAALQCSAFPPRYFPGYSIDCSTLLQSCPMN